MPAGSDEFAHLIRDHLIPLPGVTKTVLRRHTADRFPGESGSGCLYFLDSGQLKLYRFAAGGRRVLLRILSPGELFCEQVILRGADCSDFGIEAIGPGLMYSIATDTFVGFCDENPAGWRLFAKSLVEARKESERKIALLHLRDVAYRILDCLAELTTVFPAEDSPAGGHVLPLSQHDLGDLVGATRETTSTLLNSLCRDGLVRLGRCQLTVPSPDALRNAARERLSRNSGRSRGAGHWRTVPPTCEDAAH